jgi:hypothetical protein
VLELHPSLSLQTSYPVRIRYAMMHLNRAVCLDYPETDIPWFHEKYCQQTAALGNIIYTVYLVLWYNYINETLKQSRYTPWWRLGERRYSSYSFLNSALDEGAWSASRPSRAFPRGKDHRYPLYRRLGGPQSWSGHTG